MSRSCAQLNLDNSGTAEKIFCHPSPVANKQRHSGNLCSLLDLRLQHHSCTLQQLDFGLTHPNLNGCMPAAAAAAAAAAALTAAAAAAARQVKDAVRGNCCARALYVCLRIQDLHRPPLPFSAVHFLVHSLKLLFRGES
jgi:hypothetical protein